MVNAGLGLNSMITPTLATVNIISNASSIVGVGLALSGVGLYFLRSVRPGLARDHDIFFAAVALVCGGILFFNGWRQDPILQFGQFMLTGSAIFFAVESIRLRAVATEQAKRTTPVVDDDRPVSRVYRAELDELDALDEEARPVTRRIRGTRDRSTTDEYSEDVRRRPPSRDRSDRLGSGDPYGDSANRPRRRRPPTSSRPERPAPRSEADEYWGDVEDRPTRSRSSSRSSDSPPASRPRRSRPPQDAARRSRVESERSPSDYVDYQPIDYSADDPSNPRDYD
jgi:hypothetical protein